MASLQHMRSSSRCARKPFGSSTLNRRACMVTPIPARPLVPRTRANASSSTAEMSSRLLQLLEQGGSSSELDNLVTQLSSTGSDFSEDLIGGGPWMVSYQRGIPILWGLGWQLGKVVRGENLASQDLDPSTRKVVSKVQYLGDKLYVTASGVYQPEGTSSSTPKKVDVTVTSGCIHFFGLNIPLPISGKGSFEVLYLDSSLRIFRAPTGLVVVQVKWDKLKVLTRADSDLAVS